MTETLRPSNQISREPEWKKVDVHPDADHRPLTQDAQLDGVATEERRPLNDLRTPRRT
jgi:hypothetical protein